MTDTVPQDTSLPDDVVERVSRLAYDAMGSLGAYLRDGEDMGRAIVDGDVDVRLVVRVISAALKEASHG